MTGPRLAGSRRSTVRWLLTTAGLTLATLVGNITYNVMADQVSNRVGPVTWLIPGLGLLVTGALAGLELRWRAQDRHGLREPPPPVPEQPAGMLTDLPYTSGFAGREKDVARLCQALRTEHAVAVLGRPAVGTSACAVQAANLVRDQFPDGQLYLDLRVTRRAWAGRRQGRARIWAGRWDDGPAMAGWARWRGEGRALRPREVLASLAGKLDVPPPASGRPADLEATAGALRARLADRCVLLVLDNVSDPAQVRALLPPPPACRLLLAGTPALNGLDGLHVQWLAEPDPAEAVELFAAAADAAPSLRVRRPDPYRDPAVPRLVELCGRQPRAVRALGWQLARHGWRSDELLATLAWAARTSAWAGPGSRPAAGPAVRMPYAAALDLLCTRDTAYAALGPGARRMFRLLSLTGQPLSRDAIGALTGSAPARVDRLLDELASGAFVEAATGDRYQVRALLVGYARLHLRRDEPAWRQARARARLVRHLAGSAERHAAALTTPVPSAAELGDDSYHWFELHHELLRAQVVTSYGQLPRTARRWWFRLAVALCGWYAYRGDLAQWAAVCRAVLGSTPDNGRSPPVPERPAGAPRPAVAGWAYNELGVIARRRGDPHAAAVELTLAVAYRRRRRGGAQSRTNLGLAQLDQGEVDEAIEHLEWARRHRSPADRAGQALTDLGLGAAYLARGEPAKARQHLVTAANRFDALGEQRGYAAALTNLVLAHWQLGEHLDAVLAATTAISVYDRLDTDRVDDPVRRAAALLNAGAALLGGERAHAQQAYQLLSEGVRLRADQPPSAGHGRTLYYLGDAAAALDRPQEARGHWARAADVCAKAGDVAGRTAAEHRLSRTE